MSTINVKEVKFGDHIEIGFDTLNEVIDQWEPVKRGFKEMPHPDLRGAMDDIAQQMMQIFGFPNTHPSWGAYKIKKVTFANNNFVSAVIVFNHSLFDMLEIKLPKTDEIPVQVVDSSIEEIKKFISGEKKGQGELFDFDVPDAEYEDPSLEEGETLALAE